MGLHGESVCLHARRDETGRRRLQHLHVLGRPSMGVHAHRLHRVHAGPNETGRRRLQHLHLLGRRAAVGLHRDRLSRVHGRPNETGRRRLQHLQLLPGKMGLHAHPLRLPRAATPFRCTSLRHGHGLGEATTGDAPRFGSFLLPLQHGLPGARRLGDVLDAAGMPGRTAVPGAGARRRRLVPARHGLRERSGERRVLLLQRPLQGSDELEDLFHRRRVQGGPLRPALA
jgi:hypothetical protein